MPGSHHYYPTTTLCLTSHIGHPGIIWFPYEEAVVTNRNKHTKDKHILCNCTRQQNTVYVDVALFLFEMLPVLQIWVLMIKVPLSHTRTPFTFHAQEVWVCQAKGPSTAAEKNQSALEGAQAFSMSSTV